MASTTRNPPARGRHRQQGHARPSPSGPKGLPASRGRGPDGDGRRTANRAGFHRSPAADADTDTLLLAGCCRLGQHRVICPTGTGEQSPSGLRRSAPRGVGGRTVLSRRSRRRAEMRRERALFQPSNGMSSTILIPQRQMAPTSMLDQPDKHPAGVRGAVCLRVLRRSENVQPFALRGADQTPTYRACVELGDAIRFRQIERCKVLNSGLTFSRPRCASTIRTARGGFLVPRS